MTIFSTNQTKTLYTITIYVLHTYLKEVTSPKASIESPPNKPPRPLPTPKQLEPKMASIVAIVVKGALSLTKVITEISKRVVQNGLATSKIRNGSALAIIKKLVSFFICVTDTQFSCAQYQIWTYFTPLIILRIQPAFGTNSRFLFGSSSY